MLFLDAFVSIAITGRLLRAARGLLNWSKRDLARKAGISPGTVKHMEVANGPVPGRHDTVRVVVMVLEKAGVEFLPDGVRYRGR